MPGPPLERPGARSRSPASGGLWRCNQMMVPSIMRQSVSSVPLAPEQAVRIRHDLATEAPVRALSAGAVAGAGRTGGRRSKHPLQSGLTAAPSVRST